MMDQERTSKELQEVFEEVQHSYSALLDDVFLLQERILKLAWNLFESSAENQVKNTQATLEDLARQSKSQREARETLASQTTVAFMKVLEAPYEDHSIAEEAKTDLEEASSS
jgi:hypothetical protein